MADNVNRTNKNTPNNRGKLTEKQKFLLLRSVWQGLESGNITYSNDLDFDPAELDIVYRELDAGEQS